MHRHDCDLWQPPAPSSRTNVYREDANFPPRSPRQLGSESMDGGRGARRETARGSAAWPPICSLQDERAEENRRCVRELLLPHCSIVLKERRIRKKKKTHKFPPDAQSQWEAKTTSAEMMRTHGSAPTAQSITIRTDRHRLSVSVDSRSVGSAGDQSHRLRVRSSSSSSSPHRHHHPASTCWICALS